jgi:magnesium chelatase family protein
VCAPERIARYVGRISGPLLDRIDLQLTVRREEDWFERSTTHAETSAMVRVQVTAARERQLQRQGCLNKHLTPAQIVEFATPLASAQTLLRRAFNQFNLSPRAYHRVLKVARTIADLAARPEITDADVAEALHLRLGSDASRPP